MSENGMIKITGEAARKQRQIRLQQVVDEQIELFWLGSEAQRPNAGKRDFFRQVVAQRVD